MKYESYLSQDISQVLASLQTTSDGLSQQEVVNRQKQYGPNNVLLHKKSVLSILINQFRSYLVLLLLGAIGLSLIVSEYTQALLILFFLVINAILGFYQEYKSERIVELLKQYLRLSARVKRDGVVKTIDAQGLVPGDIVLLEAGDRIPADIRFIEVNDALVDESVLTGESMPVHKLADALAGNFDLMHASNIGFCGTVLTNGTASGVVLATGQQTMVGDISSFITTISRESSFFQDIKKLSKFLFWFVIITMIGVFLIHFFVRGSQTSIVELLSFSIALAVAIAPEVLPTVIAFALARGAMKLSKHKVIVKRLSAIEDLGNIDILCTDKTGTLTENVLTLKDIIAHDAQKVLEYALYAASTFFDQEPNKSLNAFDITIKSSLSPESLQKIKDVKKITIAPFVAERLRTTVVVQEQNKLLLIVRGAEEAVIPRTALTKDDDDLLSRVAPYKESGDRVIAIAYRQLSSEHEAADVIKDEQGLTLLGFLVFADPIKKDVPAVIKRLKDLKVGIKILTGDAPEVARQVAMQVNIVHGEKVITGAEFDKLSHRQQEQAVEQYNIFARINPVQKYTIVQLLQEKYRVGYMGEGVNDAPVLKQADVGIVVQQAIDVARESADIILLKKSLTSVVEAIYQGRLAVNNIAKYIRITLSANFGNFYSLALSSLFLDYLPMLPIQLLLANLLSDIPMLAIASDTVDIDELEKPKRFSIKELFIFTVVFGLITVPFDIILLIHFRFAPTVLRTAWFIETIITELVVIIALRSKRFFLKAKKPSWVLFSLLAMTLCMALVVTYVCPFQQFFKFTSLAWSVIWFIVILCTIYFITTECTKAIYYRLIDHKNHI